MSDGMRELELAGVIDGAESSILPGLTPTPHDIARAVIAAGWVSPEEHHETLDDYGQAVGDLNLANYRLGRVEALAGELEAADSGSNAADYRLARFVVSEIRAALAADQTQDTPPATNPVAT